MSRLNRYNFWCYLVGREARRWGPLSMEALVPPGTSITQTRWQPVGGHAHVEIQGLERRSSRQAGFWKALVAAYAECRFSPKQEQALRPLMRCVEFAMPEHRTPEHRAAGQEHVSIVIPYLVRANDTRTPQALLMLSLLFGCLAGRLHLCLCGNVVLTTQLRRRQTCGACFTTRATGLPRSAQKVWGRVQTRWAVRVFRGTLSREDRDTMRRQALADMGQVKRRRLSLGEWGQQWDTRQRAGRPRKHGR